MSTLQKYKYLFILITVSLLAACGGEKRSKKDQISSNYRLVSIDYDKSNNDAIDSKFYYEYDSNGDNVKIENTDFNNKLLNVTTTKIFDINGNVLNKKDKHFDVDKNQFTTLRKWTFTYNKLEEKSSETYEDFENSTYHHWSETENTRTYYSKAGSIISINNFTADKHGNKLHQFIDNNNDGEIDKQVRNTYNKNSKLLTSITTDPNDTSNTNLRQETRRYDLYGNIISLTILQPSKNTASIITKYQYTYDAYKNILTSSTIFDSGDVDKRIYVWEEISPPVSFSNAIDWAGTGCKAGSVAISGENTATLSLLFDSYDAGKDSKSGLKRSACSFSLAIKVLSGYQISQLTTDWEGFVEGEGELGRKYFLAGQANTAWLNSSYKNNEGANFSKRDNINHESFSTDCNGGEYNLRIDSQIKAIDENSYIAVDSADLNGKVKFLLSARACR